MQKTGDLFYLTAAMLCAVLFYGIQISCWSQRMPPRVTVEEVDESVRSAVPAESSVSQVIAFIDSLRIGSLRIVRNEYLPGLPDDNLEHIPANIERATAGYLVAAIVNVERDDLAAYNIDIYFYFGKDGKLIYYTVKKHGTVP